MGLTKAGRALELHVRATRNAGWARRLVLGGLGALGMAGAALATTGCPENSCFLKYCENGRCSCPVSSCPDGAAFDIKQNRCRCVVGFFDVAGQCLDQTHANAYCGKGYAFQGGGCVQLQCRPGDHLDLQTGLCVPKEQVAQQAGVQLGQGQKVGCPAGQVLVVDSGASACVPAAQSCAKDEVWNGSACQKTAACQTGSTWDPTRNQCVGYTNGGGEGALSVDVATWSASNYGPNGGPGTPSFCSTFAKKPYSFGIAPGSSAVVRVQITMSFADQSIQKGQLFTAPVFDVSNGPVGAKGTADVQAGAYTTFEALVAGGGHASVASFSTSVKCTVTNSAKPQAVPESGGF